MTPSFELLSGFRDALRSGWSPDNLRPQAAEEHIARIDADAAGFLASLEDRDAKGPPIALPDGSQVPRLPGFHRWIWRHGFCGSISARWQPGTVELPPHCLGHVGYSIVPWRRNEGLATAALIEMLPLLNELRLPYIVVSTDPGNRASRRVIEKAGGRLIGERKLGPEMGGRDALFFRIEL